MKYEFTTRGTCARGIEYELTDGVVRNIRFIGGCSGNTQGVAALAEGRTPQEIVRVLKGIRCGAKPTSCPDQLAQALEQAMAREAQA